MRALKITLFIAVHICTSISLCFAQSNDLEARVACLKGEEEYDSGNYSKAITYLQEAKSILGETKPRIQYTLVRALKAAGRYAQAKKELKVFFDITPEDNSGDHFLEMVKNIADLNEYARLEEEKVRAAQVQEQQRLAAIEREKREREIERLEEQRKAEARRVEAARLELEYNKKMAVAGTWSKVGDTDMHFPSYIQIFTDNKTVSVKFFDNNIIFPRFFKIEFSGVASNCSSNLCKLVEGNFYVSAVRDLGSRKQAKETLNSPSKIYMNEEGSKLIVELREYRVGRKNMFRDEIVLSDKVVKLEFTKEIIYSFTEKDYDFR